MVTGCVGGDVDNPVGQMLFGDSATLVRATMRQKELVTPPIACSSCSVDPQCLQWPQQSRLVLSLLEKEDRGHGNTAFQLPTSAPFLAKGSNGDPRSASSTRERSHAGSFEGCNL